MNLAASIEIYASGTSEGVRKAWDTRGRGRHTDVQKHIAAHERAFPAILGKFKTAVGGMGVVDGRVKTLDSLTEKLTRKNKTLDQIGDTIGLRLTTSDIPTVYRALDALHKDFTVTKVDDRIAKPADGVYRALHLDAEVGGKKIEIQLRTSNQTKLADYMHPLYKNKELGKTGMLMRSYLKKLSVALYREDSGQKAVLPDCPPPIAKTVGCFTRE
jgi:(p)ppGpp synthase/HD superfamily hydrolase